MVLTAWEHCNKVTSLTQLLILILVVRRLPDLSPNVLARSPYAQVRYFCALTRPL